jgi:hypothetical protein
LQSRDRPEPAQEAPISDELLDLFTGRSITGREHRPPHGFVTPIEKSEDP